MIYDVAILTDCKLREMAEIRVRIETIGIQLSEMGNIRPSESVLAAVAVSR